MRDGRIAYDGPPIDASRRPTRRTAPDARTTTTPTGTRARPAPTSALPLGPGGSGRWSCSPRLHGFKPCSGALFTGLAAPAMGTYLVQRRLSLMGDGIGHICVTGVALGLLTGTSPTFTAVVVAVIGAVLIELIRSRPASGDVALALLFYGGIAGGLVLTARRAERATLSGYLFGSITTISATDVVVTRRCSPVVIVVVASALRLSCSRSRTTRTSPGRRAQGAGLQPAGLGARRGDGDASRCAPSACCWSAP